MNQRSQSKPSNVFDNDSTAFDVQEENVLTLKRDMSDVTTLIRWVKKTLQWNSLSSTPVAVLMSQAISSTACTFES